VQRLHRNSKLLQGIVGQDACGLILHVGRRVKRRDSEPTDLRRQACRKNNAEHHQTAGAEDRKAKSSWQIVQDTHMSVEIRLR